MQTDRHTHQICTHTHTHTHRHRHTDRHTHTHAGGPSGPLVGSVRWGVRRNSTLTQLDLHTHTDTDTQRYTHTQMHTHIFLGGKCAWAYTQSKYTQRMHTHIDGMTSHTHTHGIFICAARAHILQRNGLTCQSCTLLLTYPQPWTPRCHHHHPTPQNTQRGK